MTKDGSFKRILCVLLAALLLSASLSACSAGKRETQTDAPGQTSPTDTSRYLIAVEDEPDTVDFQCTSIHYTIAQNVFNRLVDMKVDENGHAVFLPELAERWTVSADRRAYTFHLREGVKFSNGEALTASDVLYTFTRLLTHPDSCNRDVADMILGADSLQSGLTNRLLGFEVLGELDFVITLEQPFEAFLACLSMPGASILDEQTMRRMGGRFGTDPAWTIGTGSFILDSWEPGKGMLLSANPNCWQGPPRCEGLDLRFMTDAEEIRLLFDKGGLDVLNLDDVGRAAEFFLHGDIYQDRLYSVQRIGMTYIALNEAVPPLDDVRVRRAMQLALNRTILLDAAYSGRGLLENGIMPHGLHGYNPDLPEIPCDTQQAAELLREAGLPEDFTLTISVSAASTQGEMSLIRAAVSMWEKVGLPVSIRLLPDAEFMRLRKNGELACYCASWSADFNDPDNFFYTFFGNRENTRFRSLCYPREEIMERVRAARTITDTDARIAEYRELERIIVQEDAAWIPLFSRSYPYVVSERLENMQASWNGSVKNEYREMSIREDYA